jgi:type IV pilus assembly protein PilW
MKRIPKPQRVIRGFSLVELLVAMAIALILTLAIATVMTNSEGSKRSITSTNDVNQTGAYVSYTLDRALRSAGSGYAQRWNDAFGCLINASRDSAVMLPRAGALPAPFAAVTTPIALAPVVITKGAGANGSDVLTVMTGTGGFGETAPRVMPASIALDSLRLPNTLGMRANDLVLVAEEGVGCMLQQVKEPFTGTADQNLPFAGRYYSATGAKVSLSAFGSAGTATTYVVQLGNAKDNPPLFQLFGVGANNTLFSYDLLRISDTDAAVPIAEGVVQLRALYGVDTTGDGKQDLWVDPGASGSEKYAADKLLDGSAASRLLLRQIVSVRLGLLLRGTAIEKDDAPLVAPATITLFKDLDKALQQDIPLSTAEQRSRHRAVEVTVPLRNVLMLPAV